MSTISKQNWQITKKVKELFMKTKILFLIMLISFLALSANNYSQEKEFQFYEYAVMDSVLLWNFFDVNNDGHLDLVYRTYETHNNQTREWLKVQYGDGTLHGLVYSENYDIVREPPNSRAVTLTSDLNNDGSSEAAYVTPISRYLCINFDCFNTDNYISAHIDYDDSNLPYDLTRNTGLCIELDAPCDFNGDGIDDLLVQPKMGITQPYGYIPSTYIYFGGEGFDINNPDVEIRSEFISYTECTLIGRGWCKAGDLDGDGIDDLIVPVQIDVDLIENFNWNSIPCNTIRIYWGGQNFGEEFTDYTMPVSFNPMYQSSVNVKTIDNNGKNVLITHFSYNRYLLSFDEERNATIYTAEDLYGSLPYSFIDINGDGLKDYLYTGSPAYARLGEHSHDPISFSEETYPITGLPHNFSYAKWTITGLSDTKYDVLMTYVRGNNINDSWIRFYTLDEVSSVDNVIAPEIFSLYPIPFRDELNIQIKTKLQKPTNVAVYNIKGQKIRELASDEAKNISWDGKDLFGKNVSSGIYFVKVKQDNQQQIKKVLKIK